MLSPLYKAIILYLVLTGILLYIKPTYFVDDKGFPKKFGISFPFSYYIVNTVISSIAYILWSIFPSKL